MNTRLRSGIPITSAEDTFEHEHHELLERSIQGRDKLDICLLGANVQERYCCVTKSRCRLDAHHHCPSPLHSASSLPLPY